MISKNGWDIVYKQAEYEDGHLLFPQKLTRKFLDAMKKTLGSYSYANQYLNQVIPEDARMFRKTWFKYYEKLPTVKNTYIMIDPAISLQVAADFTGIVVVDIDQNNNWYIRYAKRHKITPTQLIELIFKMNEQFKPQSIGIESVAFQKMIFYVLIEEMKRRNIVIPVHEVKASNDKTKEQKIQALIPRYEWGMMFHDQGLLDLEMELLTFPRGEHDDIIDSLSMVEFIQNAPIVRVEQRKLQPHEAGYEKQYIENLVKERQGYET